MKAGIKQLTTGLLHCGPRPNFDIELHNEVKNASTILYMYQYSWLQIWLFLLCRFKRRGWISCCSVPTDPWYNKFSNCNDQCLRCCVHDSLWVLAMLSIVSTVCLIQHHRVVNITITLSIEVHKQERC
jgi:hypothetical protein